MRGSILSIFWSNFQVVGVFLYGVWNILSLGATKIFHFDCDNDRFSWLDHSLIEKISFSSNLNMLYTIQFEILCRLTEIFHFEGDNNRFSWLNHFPIGKISFSSNLNMLYTIQCEIWCRLNLNKTLTSESKAISRYQAFSFS